MLAHSAQKSDRVSAITQKALDKHYLKGISLIAAIDRYVKKFKGRHNVEPLDTADQMATMAARTVGKHLPYEVLIEPEYSRLAGGI